MIRSASWRNCLSKENPSHGRDDRAGPPPHRDPARRHRRAGDFGDYHQFPGLKAFERIRCFASKTAREVNLFALSRTVSPAELLRVVRAHWAIENALHWEFDVVVAEDAARNRRDHGSQYLAVLRRLALNVARADKTESSLAGKLRQAGWNDDFLLELLAQTR
ncbi:ISAs1 family transposase [Rhodoplanes sp. SY1]|uniref:ISAs1 family transposase n=1 Tax=Rhodoplanes sp. SY1 TaxID=3166646 RepID=UPI0038B59F05